MESVGAISVHKAEILTATVEVKTLRISGKQMTLSVFRQLLEESLHNTDDGSAKGTVWGRVNYYWGNCADGDHLHVVWQRDDALRRACVYSGVKHEAYLMPRYIAVAGQMLEVVQGVVPMRHEKDVVTPQWRLKFKTYADAGFPVEGMYWPYFVHQQKDLVLDALNRIGVKDGKLDGSWDMSNFGKDAYAVCSRMVAAFRVSYDRLYAECKTSPHLFIAV